MALKMFRAIFFLFLLVCPPADAGFGIFQVNGTPLAALFTPQWQTLAEGDGGQGTGFDAHSDGTLLTWNNTYGANLYKPSTGCTGWGTNYATACWEQLFTATSVTPSITFPNGINNGGISAAACDSNTNVAYALWNGFLWVTQNLKAAQPSRRWTQTTLTTTQNPNDNNLIGRGNYLACDPHNPNIAYIATPSALKVTLDGGSTFATVTGVGTTGAIPSAIYFDPASATTGTCPASCFTNHFYVFTYSTGVYETYNGGTPQSGAFTLTSTGPTTFYGMDKDKFSQLWVVNGSASVFKYVPNGTAGGGTWSTSTPGVCNSQAFTVAVDPTSSSLGANRVVAAYYDGQISVSTNNAGSWTSSTSESVSAPSPQPTWMATANQFGGCNGIYLSNVSMLFDFSGNLWGAGGIANWKVVPTVGINPTWVADTVGIEQLVGIGVLAPLGNSPITWQWDRAFITINNLDTFPSTYYPGALTSNIYGSNWSGVQGGWALDYASSNTNFFTGWGGESVAVPASTADGGYTWTTWPTVPAGGINVGGAVAASTSTNWITVVGINKALNFTTNAATGWTPSTVPGTPNWIGTKGVRQPLAADRVNANTFCAIDTAQNVYSSIDSGQTFTKRINAGVLDGNVGVDMLVAVPGQAGQFFYTASNASGSSAGTNRLWKITKTTNECDTAAVPNSNLTGVYAFGFGAPKPGNSYPTIYAYGLLSGVLGLYESDDIAVTWALINAPASQQVWPKNSQDFVTWVTGDMNVYGVVYVQFRGSGGAYIQHQNSCPYVNFTTAFKPTSALTGTVNLQATLSGLVPVSGVNFYLDGTTQIGSTQTGAGPYSVSFNASAQTVGNHTLTVSPIGNGCNSYNQNYNRFVIPITTS